MMRRRRFLACAALAAAPFSLVVFACGSSDDSAPENPADSGVDTGTSFDAAPDVVTNNDAAKQGDSSTIDASVVDKSAACDLGIVEGADPISFAKTIGVCTNATTDGYGLVTATYSTNYYEGDAGAVLTTSTSEQASSFHSFGDVLVPREGNALGAMSTGYAFSYDNANFTGSSSFVGTHRSGSTGILPAGFPKATPGCAQSAVASDVIDVKLTLKAPADAHGFRFDFNFFSSDWPNDVCSSANDAFIAYVKSASFSGGIANDSAGGPISVNTSFFDRCTPGTTTGCDFMPSDAGLSWPCDAGTTELGGTGFGLTGASSCVVSQTTTLGGGTGWLTASAPIAPGETFTLDLIIFNASDQSNDSSVLVDNFEWLSDAVVSTTRAQ